jgi:hypothetical protein
MAILKLIPGQKINLTVRSIEEVEGNYGPQYKFSGATADDANATLFLNVDTALRQLARAGFPSADAVVNTTIEVERVEKNGTKYTNISRLAVAHRVATTPAGPGMPQPSSPPVSTNGYDAQGRDFLDRQQETGAPPADESVSRLDGVLSLHDVCVMHATKSTARILKDAGFTPTAADILAAAATQMIGAQKIGARVG